jgi:hypothetical protein
MYLLEVKLLSLQAPLLRYMMQNKTYVELNTADGQHFRVDLNGSKTDTYRLNSSSLFSINETLRVLIPATLMTGNSSAADEFLYMTIHTDGTWDECNATDITQRVAALANETDAFFPAPAAGSFKPERSKSMFSSKKSVSAPFKEPDLPREPVHRTVIKLCNRVVIPLSGLMQSAAEQEKQVTLFKLNCRWLLKVFKVDGQYQRRTSETTYTYFLVFLADSNGEPIYFTPPEKDIGSPQRSPSKQSKSKPSNPGDRPSGQIFKSSSTPNGANASWGDGEVVEISTEKHGDAINHAKFVMIQFWSKTAGGANPDTPLGEILIPLLSAKETSADCFESGGLEHAEKHRILLPSILSTRKTSQTVNTGLIASTILNMCTSTNGDYDSSDRASIKLATSVKPVQSADCSWPCRFLSKQLGGAEAEAFYFFPAHDGLYIIGQANTSGGDLKRHPNSVGSVLSECAERKSFAGQDNRLQLMVPYSQVAAHEMHIITDNMLVLNVQLKRCIKVPGSSLNSIQKDIKLEILVGPCLAKDLYTIMHNRISLHSIRSTLSAYATDKRKEEQELFEDVARMLQDEILSTMMGIDQFLMIKPHDSGHGHQEHSHLFPLKLLYLKKAALKIYLWFLIEQTKLQFGGKSSYVESSWLLFDEFNTENEDGASILEDPDALMQRIGHTMEHLDKDVRSMVFQAHKLAKNDISDKLSPMVYDRYLTVINYLVKSVALERASSGAPNEKIYTTADPQKKRDLIKFVITHDNLFEATLNSTLRPHDYQFTTPPLLSTCIDFEQLIDKFASLVNENILLWNARTFEHFRTHKEKSDVLSNHDFAPWAVTTMIESNTNHELYISNIPETIQTQLNVEIGLKKVPIAGSNLGTTSLSRVYLLNQKISAAIAKVYLALASEYEKVLISGLQNKVVRDANAKSKNAMAVSEDDMICFLVSIVNDCHRMYTQHIPDSMSNFLEEEDENGGGGGENARGSMASIMESVQKEGVTSIMDQSCMLFLVSSRAMEAVSQNAINLLSNQIFFFSELRVYFLLAFDAHVVSSQSSRWKNRRSGVPDPNKTESHSPIEVICATLSDFFQFTSQHLNDDDIEKLLYVCTKKVVIRYLVFLRDLLVMLPGKKSKALSRRNSFRKSAGERLSDSSDEPCEPIYQRPKSETVYGDDPADAAHEEDVPANDQGTFSGVSSIYDDSPLQPEQILKIKADVKSIIRLHSILKLKILQAGSSSAGTGGGSSADKSFDAASEVDKEEREYQTFFNNSAANLFSIVSDVANRLMMGEITDTATVDDVIYNFFSITVSPSHMSSGHSRNIVCRQPAVHIFLAGERVFFDFHRTFPVSSATSMDGGPRGLREVPRGLPRAELELHPAARARRRLRAEGAELHHPDLQPVLRQAESIQELLHCESSALL